MPDSRDAQAYLDQLVAELESRGLHVAARLPALAVRNPAVAGTDPRGARLSPGMTQQILIRDYEGRGLTWCWVWPGPESGERGAPTPEPEIEAMCPASEIELAADRIVNVVRLRDTVDLPGGNARAPSG
jgi:hypothetical protein